MAPHEPRDPPERGAIADAMESTLGWNVTDVEAFDEGLNAVFRVDRSDDDPVVVKTATFVGDEELLVEAALCARFEDSTDVPVPSVYATFEPETTRLGIAAFVMEYCGGREVAHVSDLSREAQGRLVTESGRHLASLHGVRIVDGYGPLRLDDNRIVSTPRYESWDAWFDELVAEALDNLQGEGFTTDSNPRFADLEPPIREALSDPARSVRGEVDPSFLYFDYRPNNLVLAPENEAESLIRAVIDIGSSSTGDGLLDLALAENALIDIPLGGRKRADHLRDRLRTAYCDARNIDDSTFASPRYTSYRLFALTRRMSRFDYWAQFAREEDQEAIASRWRSSARNLVDELG